MLVILLFATCWEYSGRAICCKLDSPLEDLRPERKSLFRLRHVGNAITARRKAMHIAMSNALALLSWHQFSFWMAISRTLALFGC